MYIFKYNSTQYNTDKMDDTFDRERWKWLAKY